jgi:ribonucleoside-diphosphate reductase alpha chain
MRTIRLWQGVRMRSVEAAGEPDANPRQVTIPAAWEDAAAEALAALVPGEGAVSLAASSAVWLGVVGQRARQAGEDDTLALCLHGLLRRRQAAPTQAIWRLDFEAAPGFVLNLGAFHTASAGFDVGLFAQAARAAARACQLLAPEASHFEIGMAGLDDLLAALGVEYATRVARDTAACLAALLRSEVTVALEGQQRDLLAMGADWPTPPTRSAIPGLAEAAWTARETVSLVPGTPPATGIFAPGPADALLGVETSGIAPAFAPVRAGRLSRAAQDRLAAAGLSPEAALAASLQGDDPLPSASVPAHEAMFDAVAPFIQVMPPRPVALPCPAAGQVPPPAHTARPRKLPAHHTGMTVKATVGGHRIFVRTGEYDDGTLGELAITLPKESAAVRGLMEAVAQAVSIGLQHGVRLDHFIDAFANTEFAPAGAVEGDPAVGHATSLLDYVFRSLSVNYLGQPLPEVAPAEAPLPGDERSPLLPLDLPRGASPRMRRRALRVVG